VLELLKLEPSVAVEFRNASWVAGPPRLFLGASTVSIGPAMTWDDHQRHIFESTFGSADRLGPAPVDEYRFSRSDRLLVSVGLTYPEYAECDEERVARWLTAEAAVGNLRLCEPHTDFYAEPAATQWSSERQLVLLREKRERCGAERLRAEVAEGFSLLFADGLLAGWMLEEPERRLVSGSGRPSRDPPDAALASFLDEFLHLLTFPAMDPLLDGDPVFRGSLEELYARISLDAGAIDRREALRGRIEELIEEWYP
jgi:hypothetical protein